MKSQTKNILVVEDSSDDAELIKRKFKSRNIEGDLHIAKDGEDALNYLLHRKKYSDKDKFPVPTLILLDIRMPKMNGIEVLKEIKSNNNLKKIPVVMLTVSTLQKDVSDSFDVGCEHYVTKSVGFEKFEETLEPIIKYYVAN